jgi:hypothetical protein
VAAGLYAQTGGRVRLASPERIVITLPHAGPRRGQLQAAQDALGELVTFVGHGDRRSS